MMEILSMAFKGPNLIVRKAQVNALRHYRTARALPNLTEAEVSFLDRSISRLESQIAR